MKNLVPKRLGDKVAEYRAWRDDTMDFADVANPGLGAFMKQMIHWKGEDTEELIDVEMQKYNYVNGATNIDGDASVAIWRLLKRCTEGAPLALVLKWRGRKPRP